MKQSFDLGAKLEPEFTVTLHSWWKIFASQLFYLSNFDKVPTEYFQWQRSLPKGRSQLIVVYPTYLPSVNAAMSLFLAKKLEQNLQLDWILNERFSVFHCFCSRILSKYILTTLLEKWNQTNQSSRLSLQQNCSLCRYVQQSFVLRTNLEPEFSIVLHSWWKFFANQLIFFFSNFDKVQTENFPM